MASCTRYTTAKAVNGAKDQGQAVETPGLYTVEQTPLWTLSFNRTTLHRKLQARDRLHTSRHTHTSTHITTLHRRYHCTSLSIEHTLLLIKHPPHSNLKHTPFHNPSLRPSPPSPTLPCLLPGTHTHNTVYTPHAPHLTYTHAHSYTHTHTSFCSTFGCVYDDS